MVMTKSEAARLGAIAARPIIAKMKQDNIDKYYLNPKICECCKKVITYEKRRNKFCSHRCAAIINNSSIDRINTVSYCLNCGKILKRRNKKYCSSICQNQYQYSLFCKKSEEQGYFNGYDSADTGGRVRRPKRYILEKQNGKCVICGIDTWMEKPVPFVLDHIDGNSCNWEIKNLRVICRNCDGQLLTYAGKNKGTKGIRPTIRYRNKYGKYVEYKNKKAV